MESIGCKGFQAAGIEAGIKKKGGKDLGLIYSEVPASVAGVFTKNLVQAAPVVLDRQRIRTGRSQAVIVNSGNANCCTGPKGMADAENMARAAARELNIEETLVLTASTGVIGQPFPIHKIEAAAPALVKALKPDGFNEFAQAIMTTDLVPKLVSRAGQIQGKPFSMIGVAKGSGMIYPNMATMLCFVCTDLDIASDLLQKTLSEATDQSFNRITVDGDTSTNDTILLMVNGASGAKVKTSEDQTQFQILLNDVLLTLAKMVVKDGEGATKFVEIRVNGAASDADAKTIAATIANSNLVKTALFGQDANWGRILAAAGRAGVPMNPNRADIWFDQVQMVKAGIGCGEAAEAEATKILKKPEFIISLDLHTGSGWASVFTCDFSIDYVKINADYRS